MHSQKIPAAPDLFSLRKLKPEEITDSSSLIYCENRFFPVSIHGVAAIEYGQPIYKITEVDKETGEAA